MDQSNKRVTRNSRTAGSDCDPRLAEISRLLGERTPMRERDAYPDDDEVDLDQSLLTRNKMIRLTHKSGSQQYYCSVISRRMTGKVVQKFLAALLFYQDQE